MSKLILKILGWKIVSNFREDMKRAVLVIAPHTSNMDFIIGRLIFNVLKIKVRFLIKEEAFRFPLGYFLKKWGGIPVDRKQKKNMVDRIASYFRDKDEMIIVITPEGTRSYVKHWKKGFYYIAEKANVPIVLGFLDYKKKKAGLGDVFYPGGNYEKDIERIYNFYQDKTAKNPEKFNLSAIKQ